MANAARRLTDSKAMALYATGFNAWGQLSFGTNPEDQEPNDNFEFVQVLQGDDISAPVSRLSYTVVHLDGQLHTAGISPEDEPALQDTVAVAEAANGEILTAQSYGADILDGQVTREASHVLKKFSSLETLKAGRPDKCWPVECPVKQVAAFNAGFVILFEDGNVATMGDARFEDCLGRDISEDEPAADPCIVADLASLGEPIKKVSAAGYTLAALTESGGLYLWGMTPHSSQDNRGSHLPVSRVPNYVEVDGDKDVLDMAIGDSHIISLTTDGCVYVIGGNSNGQIGLGKAFVDGVRIWKKVGLNLLDGQKAIGVAAGPRASFILTTRAHT
ncbi:hypothetical protein HIM_10219 [Hirsutella minnesotensis 3608]|uniref:Regulator of chromosome condensation n=1 Tax=Hirsutella minnesotensis 3608 TaxID=1043627 RepID=A0A0F7ZKB0_9HYPO|nr:hypothetical protein HIM_10219 [Hirsutella minnesotensis 3608]